MRTIAPGRAAVADLRSKITAADDAIMARVSAASSPAAPTGEGLAIVMNCSAGTTSDDLAALLRRQLPDARVMIADATVTLRKRRDPLLVYRPES
jgi:hypothetical protein